MVIGFKIISVFFIAIFTAGNCLAEKYVVQLSFEIIESNVKPERADLVSQIDNLAKRESGGKYKYVAGGKFSLGDSYEGLFETRQKDTNLVLKAGYIKIDQEYFKVNYEANLIFPFLESAFKFNNAVRIKPGETIITDETKLAQGSGDTRPYWVVLRLSLIEPSYTEGSFGGIGAVLNVKDGYPIVVEVLGGSPAQTSGIKQGDVILQADDIDVFGKNLQEVIGIIRGKPYTPVRLKISRAEKGKETTKTLTVERWILKQ